MSLGNRGIFEAQIAKIRKSSKEPFSNGISKWETVSYSSLTEDFLEVHIKSVG